MCEVLHGLLVLLRHFLGQTLAELLLRLRLCGCGGTCCFDETHAHIEVEDGSVLSF